MKKLFAILTILAFTAIWAGAQTPTYIHGSIWSGGTVTAATATNLSATAIDARHATSIDFTFTSTNRLAAGAVSNAMALVQTSVDNSTWENGQLIQWTPTGATKESFRTNVPVWGDGYVRVKYWTNSSAASTNLTDCSLTYSLKVSSP